MADTLDLGSSAARCAGSTPAPSTLFANVIRSRKRTESMSCGVGSGPRHDIAVFGRVERPRSTAADRVGPACLMQSNPSQRETGNRDVCCGPQVGARQRRVRLNLYHFPACFAATLASISFCSSFVRFCPAAISSLDNFFSKFSRLLRASS